METIAGSRKEKKKKKLKEKWYKEEGFIKY